jgi:3-oxoacyl-[acyl-carrier-protein] synthase III
MGVVIESTAVSTDRSVRSSVAHASVAVRDCVERAKISPSDVGVLVNVGIYRDSNIVEPAIAALIQKEVGINPDYVKGGPRSMSFDLMNGACGALNGVQVAAALLTTETTRYVLVASSDAHPSNRHVETFPYATMGAAMLLRFEAGTPRGFGSVRTAPLDDGGPGVEGYAPWMTGARDVVSVDVDPRFAARALDAAEKLARETIAAEGIDVARTFLVSSQPTPRFALELAARLGIDARAVATAEDLEGDPHSSALTYGYHRATERGIDARTTATLFVAVGAGISAASTVYRH